MKRRDLSRSVLADKNKTMILGYHFIFTAYGFWLPNDPRGSWSDTVREFHLHQFGPATKTDTTRSVAHVPHDHALRLAAKNFLRYPPVRFTGIQARAIARGFAIAVKEAHYIIHALAILPDHVHMVMARHARHIDQIAAHLKAKTTIQLSKENLHPLTAHRTPSGRMPSPWSRNYWAPFLTDEKWYLSAVNYVQSNPAKSGLKSQNWACVAAR